MLPARPGLGDLAWPRGWGAASTHVLGEWDGCLWPLEAFLAAGRASLFQFPHCKLGTALPALLLFDGQERPEMWEEGLACGVPVG